MSAKKSTSPRLESIERYVRSFCETDGSRKSVNDLSALLARVVGGSLQQEVVGRKVEVGHRHFGGSVRRHHLDIWIANQHLGLQLGIDVKGLNSPESVGKNWNNRVGDLHELAVNHHSTFPRAVMGGVLAVPADSTGLDRIEAAMRNLTGRRAVANAANLLECAALLVIDKQTGEVVADRPDPAGPLRFESFAASMARIFEERWR